MRRFYCATTLCVSAITDQHLLSNLDHHLKSAHDHSLAIERHVFGIHQLSHLRVLHHGCIDLIAVGARFVTDLNNHHSLVRIVLHSLQERRNLSGLYTLADARNVFQRAVHPADFAGSFEGSESQLIHPIQEAPGSALKLRQCPS